MLQSLGRATPPYANEVIREKDLSSSWNHVAHSLLHEGVRNERGIITTEDPKQPSVQVLSVLFGLSGGLRIWNSSLLTSLQHHRSTMVGNRPHPHRFNDFLENLVQIHIKSKAGSSEPLTIIYESVHFVA